MATGKTTAPFVGVDACIQRADAVRAKLVELDLSEADVADGVAWARGAAEAPEPKAAKPSAKRRTRA